MSFGETFRVDAAPQVVLEALTGEAYNIEAEEGRRPIVSTEYRLLESSPDRKAFEMRTVEHPRTRTGRLDRSRTIDAVTRYQWDAKDESLRWEYEGLGKGRMSLGGVYRLSPSGSGTRVEQQVSLDVHVPVFGKAVAAFVSRIFRDRFPAQQELLRRHVAEGALAA